MNDELVLFLRRMMANMLENHDNKDKSTSYALVMPNLG